MKDFRELKVWQKAHKFVLEVYKTTQSFPQEELYGLTSQLRRAAVSTASNISEGCGYDTDREFGRFLKISAGSGSEAEYQLLLAHDLDYINSDKHHSLDEQIKEIKRMLNGLIKKLKANS